MGAMSQLQVKAGNSARLFIGLQGVSINGGPWQCPLSTSIGRPFTVLHQRKQRDSMSPKTCQLLSRLVSQTLGWIGVYQISSWFQAWSRDNEDPGKVGTI